MRGFRLATDPTTALSSCPRPSSNGSARSRPARPSSPPDSPWENAYIETFNARLPNEILNGRAPTRWTKPRPHPSMAESLQRVRPHGSPAYRPPVPEEIIPSIWPPGSASPACQLDRWSVSPLASRLDHSARPVTEESNETFRLSIYRHDNHEQ